MLLNRKFLSAMGQISNKAASSVDKEKPLKEYLHRDILTKPSLVCWKKVMEYVLRRKLKNRPRKLRPIRRCFLSAFTFITCLSFIILNFIYTSKGCQVQDHKLLKIKRKWKSTFISIFLKLRNMQHQIFSHKLLLKEKKIIYFFIAAVL